MHRFQIIPIFLRTAAPGDILVATLGNFSELRPPRILVAQDIRLPPLVNESDLDINGHANIYVHEGTVTDIVLPALVNVSELEGGSPLAALVDVTEAPPDGFIRLPALTNSSVLMVGSPAVGSVSVDVAPPDGIIRLPALVNSSVLMVGSPAIATVEVVEQGGLPPDTYDYEGRDNMVAGGMIAGRMS